MVSFFPLFLIIVTFMFSIDDNCYLECKDTTFFSDFRKISVIFAKIIAKISKLNDIRHHESVILLIFNGLESLFIAN